MESKCPENVLIKCSPAQITESTPTESEREREQLLAGDTDWWRGRDRELVHRPVSQSGGTEPYLAPPAT